MKMNYEKNRIEDGIPEHILNLYKIYGYNDVSYESYLKSKEAFESKISNHEIHQEKQNLLIRTRNEILAQPEENVTNSIIKAIESENIEVQRIGISLAQNAPEGQRDVLSKMVFEKILDGLNNPDIQIQRIAMNMVQFAPGDKKEQLREIVLQKIMEVFNSTDIDKQRIMAKKIKEAPVQAQDNIREMVYEKVVEAFENEDIRIQRLAALMVQYTPMNKQAELVKLTNSKFESAKQQKRFNEIIETPLYPRKPNNGDSNFSREIFSKTGSETTLLTGKQFKNNIIVKHMEEPCFSAWKKLYESHEDWVKAGFDYVPIEPIYSFNFDTKDRSINVASGVLDINLEEWYVFSGNVFREELDKQKNKIIEVLSNLNISHGHANDANFCLRFCRDEDGNANLDKTPRIFLIDFDKAVQSADKL